MVRRPEQPSKNKGKTKDDYNEATEISGLFFLEHGECANHFWSRAALQFRRMRKKEI